MGFKPKQQRVTVHWVDATCYEGWDRTDAPRQLTSVVTAGWLIKRTVEHLEVATSATDLNNVNGVMVIPRAWITKVVYGR